MSYAITYIHLGDLVASECWQRGFEEAKAHAKKAVLVGNAQRVEIRDQPGKLVFQYPRVVSPAAA